MMGIERERVELGDVFVRGQVGSLNEAYTVASRRLEPERRHPGGHIYDVFFWDDGMNRTQLEIIRKKVETGKWPEPQRGATDNGVRSDCG